MGDYSERNSIEQETIEPAPAPLEFSGTDTSCPGSLESNFRDQPYQIDFLKNDHNGSKGLFISECEETRLELVRQCSNAKFLLDTAAPRTRFVSISFDLEENGVMHHYQISSALHSWAGHLLDSGDNIISDDD